MKWHEIDHPQYGKVEVGGVKKNWGRQPPGFMLQEECHRNMAFTLFHADSMPMVGIREITAKSTEKDLWEITVIVENLKLTPTHSAVDLRRKITRPDHVTITGDGFSVVLAETSNDLLFRNSTTQTQKSATVKLPSIDGNSIVYVRWIVSGSGAGRIDVDSIKGGTARAELVLKLKP